MHTQDTAFTTSNDWEIMEGQDNLWINYPGMHLSALPWWQPSNSKQSLDDVTETHPGYFSEVYYELYHLEKKYFYCGTKVLSMKGNKNKLFFLLSLNMAVYSDGKERLPLT